MINRYISVAIIISNNQMIMKWMFHKNEKKNLIRFQSIPALHWISSKLIDINFLRNLDDCYLTKQFRGFTLTVLKKDKSFFNINLLQKLQNMGPFCMEAPLTIKKKKFPLPGHISDASAILWTAPYNQYTNLSMKWDWQLETSTLETLSGSSWCF